MDVTFLRRHKRATVVDGYRRLLVPVVDNAESEEAVDVAARLAAEHGSSITIITVVEVPAVLPADAHMRDERARAHTVLTRAAAVAERYGISVSPRTVQARDAATAIVDAARARNAELIVIGAGRTDRGLGSTVQHILKKAPCRVMIVGGRMRHRSAA
jgi:nucleotide-binding universal stress UspA family protein